MFLVNGVRIQAQSLRAIANKLRHFKKISNLKGENIVLVRGSSVTEKFKNGTELKYKIDLEKFDGVGYSGYKTTRKNLIM